MARAGAVYGGPLSMERRVPSENEATFLVNASDEPVLDVTAVERVIEQLRGFAGSIREIDRDRVKSCLYVDCKMLRAVLEPVPARCLPDRQRLMTDLVPFTIDSFARIVKSYTTRLKAEPSTLDAFVDFCEVLQRATALLPQMATDIFSVNQRLDLLDRYKFVMLPNPLHSQFAKFKGVQASAIQTRNVLRDKFAFVLCGFVKACERKLHEFQEHRTHLPACIADVDFHAFLQQTMSLRQAATNIEASIKGLYSIPARFGINLTDFPGFRELLASVDFAEKLHHVLNQWSALSAQTKLPWAHVTMKDF
jgi:hypothetical protein